MCAGRTGSGKKYPSGLPTGHAIWLTSFAVSPGRAVTTMTRIATTTKTSRRKVNGSGMLTAQGQERLPCGPHRAAPHRRDNQATRPKNRPCCFRISSLSKAARAVAIPALSACLMRWPIVYGAFCRWAAACPSSQAAMTVLIAVQAAILVPARACPVVRAQSSE